MEILLTSFGASHLPPYRLENADSFYRMPPLTMSTTYNDLVFDYSMLLLFDRVILDTESWTRMSSGNKYRGYEGMKEVVKSLHDEGFVRIVDFDSIIQSKQDLLAKMLEQDLKRLDAWVAPLQESSKAWERFVVSIRDAYPGETAGPEIEHHMSAYFHHYAHHASIVLSNRVLLTAALSSSTKRRRRHYRDALRSVLPEYLSYVNANLVLSLELSAPFHDWSDMAPFYREKLLTVGKEELPEGSRINAIKQLFEVSFPEFAFLDSKSILRILKDKRLVQLRDLVDRAVKGEVTFDREFANRTLQEALGQPFRKSRSVDVE